MLVWVYARQREGWLCLSLYLPCHKYTPQIIALPPFWIHRTHTDFEIIYLTTEVYVSYTLYVILFENSFFNGI